MEKKVPKRIMIVECFSSSINYIHDIRARGYEPILLECYTPETERAKVRAINDEAYAFNGDSYPTVLMAKEDYAQTLEMVKQFSPILILPGSDAGIELALRLSADLKLKSNPFSIFGQIRDKLRMQEALKAAGIRSVQSRAVQSESEALDFFCGNGKKKVVLKPSRAAASTHVFICSSEAEVRNAYRANAQFVQARKRTGEKIIIQEYIDGEEYVIDTVSCEGRHAALFGMKYIKRFCKGYGMIYDTDIYFSPDDETVQELVAYCFRVIDCLGIIYGPVHGEFMMDAQGPVLIEVNCRPAGAFQKYTFQDKVMQNHETAVSLDSYLMDKEQFGAAYPERMHLKQPAIVKQLCLEEPIFVKRAKLTERLSKLESFDYAIEKGENCLYPKTTDLDSNGGIIYLTAPDVAIIEQDLKTILALERDGLDELFDWS